MHNDTRPPKSVNTIRDFLMQYSYDSLVLKEHKRRLNIKNAHFNFNAKHGIDINSIVDNFRNSHENSLIFSSRKSLTKNNNILRNKPSADILKFALDKNYSDTNEVQKPKVEMTNYQTENKRENRRLNNFKINLNAKDFKGKSNYFTRDFKQILKSKSFEKLREKNSLIESEKFKNNHIVNMFKNQLHLDEHMDYSTNIKRNHSLCAIKIDNYYASTLFKEDSFFVSDDSFKKILSKDLKIDCFERRSDNKNQQNNLNNYFKVDKDNDKNCSPNQNLLIPDRRGVLKQEYEKIDVKLDLDNYMNKGALLDSKHLDFLFLNDNEVHVNNKTTYGDEKARHNYDVSLISNQEMNNYTDINSDKNYSQSSANRGRIKTRRNQVLSSILSCDVKLGSSQITITDLDKSSLRKGRVIVNNSVLAEPVAKN